MELHINDWPTYEVMRGDTTLCVLLSVEKLRSRLCQAYSRWRNLSQFHCPLDTTKLVLIIFFRWNFWLNLDLIRTSRYDSPLLNTCRYVSKRYNTLIMGQCALLRHGTWSWLWFFTIKMEDELRFDPDRYIYFVRLAMLTDRIWS